MMCSRCHQRPGIYGFAEGMICAECFRRTPPAASAKCPMCGSDDAQHMGDKVYCDDCDAISKVPAHPPSAN